MLNSFGKTDCATTRLFNNLIRGVKEENNEFGGLEGLKFFWQKVSNEISFLLPTTPVDSSTNIASLNTALDSFVSTYSVDSVTSCTNNANTVQPDII